MFTKSKPASLTAVAFAIALVAFGGATSSVLAHHGGGGGGGGGSGGYGGGGYGGGRSSGSYYSSYSAPAAAPPHAPLNYYTPIVTHPISAFLPAAQQPSSYLGSYGYRSNYGNVTTISGASSKSYVNTTSSADATFLERLKNTQAVNHMHSFFSKHSMNPLRLFSAKAEPQPEFIH